MAEKTPEELRAIDAMVAEKVMGWTLADRPGYGWPLPNSIVPAMKFRHYTRDIAADYSVLVRVRETWDIYQRQRFGLALLKSFEDRLWDDTRGHSVHEACAQYQPGDYSLAALSALGEKP